MTVEQWLGKDNKIGIDIWHKKYQNEDEAFDGWLDRVSGGNEAVRALIKEKKFLFGGRVLSNRGIQDGSSLYNCYSSGYAPDSVSGILDLTKRLALTYKAQGGQGLSLSNIRPKGTPVGTRYQSDGIVPFMEIFNTTTAAISQGSARKGALMMSLDARHKEAATFITAKSESGRFEKANLSLEVDDRFMEAVNRYYETGETVKLHEKRTYEGHAIEYDVVPIELYKLAVETCYDWGEPGFLFTNRFRNYNLMEFDENYEIVTGNPCGEQPLPKDGCCNLGSLNLAQYVLNPFTTYAAFDFTSFTKDVAVAVRALDEIIDESASRQPFQEFTQNALNYRNIGLGVMGYGSVLIMLGMEYGSIKAKEFTDTLFRVLFKSALIADMHLAKEKGAFPKCDPCIFDSAIMQPFRKDTEISRLKKYGLRNCSLISIAPTGSISTMFGISGGCEPEFAIRYTRKTEGLDNGTPACYDVFCPTAQKYMELTGEEKLPDYFVSAADIDWKARIETQGIMQDYVDTAISSTINLPHDIPLKDIERLYLYAWACGLKGVTIFRAGCKRAGIMETSSANKESTPNPADGLKRGGVQKVSDRAIGRERHLMTGCGTLHCTAFFDPHTGDLLETYLSKGSTGGCNNFMVGLSRMISLAARSGCGIHHIVDQLSSCGVCPSYAVRTATKQDTSKGSCCPVAIGNALIDMYNELKQNAGRQEIDHASKDTPIEIKNKCPQCGEKLFFEGGCNICKSCGWTKCE